LLLRTWLPYDWTPRSEAYFVFPLAQGTPGKQCGLAATGDYQPSLRSPWLAAIEGEEVQVTCSFGFATYTVIDDAIADWEWSLKIADAALYEAKEAGRNAWVGYHVDFAKIKEKMLVSDLPGLVKKGSVKRYASIHPSR